MAVASLLEGGLVKSRLDADLEDEREVVALDGSRLHPCVGQPGEEEVPQVEGQLRDDCKCAKGVDQEPSIWRLAAEVTHFLGLSTVQFY